MADKYLSPSDWKSASKGTAWKADPLTKALTTFAKAEKEGAAGALDALAEIEKQATALSKSHKGDEALASYLGNLGKSVDRRRGELQKEADAARKGGGDDDEEGADDTLIEPKRLLAQLNQLKRDPARRVNFATVDGRDDGDPLFVLSTKIAGKKIWTKLQDLSGVKAGSFGIAWIDGQTLVLQVDNKPLSGLAKKVRLPIRACGFKVGKVALWDAAGGVLEESGDDSAAGDVAAAAGGAAAPAPAAAQAAAAPDPQRLRFDERVAEFAPRLQAALSANHPAAAKMREVLAFAREKAQGSQFAPALQALDALQALLAAPAAAAPAAAASASDAAVPPRGDYARSSRAWAVTRTKLAADVGKLRDTILADYQGSPLLAEVTSKVGRLDQMVSRFDANLAAVLEQAQVAADEATRVRLHREASASIKRMLAQLDSDPILSRLHDNPFLPIDPRAALNATLQVLARQVP